jgi:hypothetical protein
MLAASSLDQADAPSTGTRSAWAERVRDTGISETTLLATDYLNHFNEIVMLIELIPDMPDMLDEAKTWEPLSYPDHFRKSGFQNRDLAIEAYEAAPPRYRQAFDATVGYLNSAVPTLLADIERDLQTGDMDRLRNRVSVATRALHRLIEAASGIIHGSASVMTQDEIDALLI